MHQQQTNTQETVRALLSVVFIAVRHPSASPKGGLTDKLRPAFTLSCFEIKRHPEKCINLDERNEQ